MTLLATLLALGLLLKRVAQTGYVPMEHAENGWHVLEALLWSAVVILLVGTPIRLKRGFSNPALGALGRWSYSLYLIHYPLIWFAFAGPNPVLRIAALPPALEGTILLGLAVAFSAFSYHFFERRFIVRSAAHAATGGERTPLAA
jgi:peptidoglycan/LPS O-acetylase OafA/YrhL